MRWTGSSCCVVLLVSTEDVSCGFEYMDGALFAVWSGIGKEQGNHYKCIDAIEEHGFSEIIWTIDTSG